MGATYIEFENQLAPTGRDLFIGLNLSANQFASADPVVKVWRVNQYAPVLDMVEIAPHVNFYNSWGTRYFNIRARITNFDQLAPNGRVVVAIINPQTTGWNLTYDYFATVMPPTVLYVGGRSNANASDGVGWISLDDGVTWTNHAFVASGPVQAAAVAPGTQGQVGYFATADLKLRKTTDGGATFTTIDFAPLVQDYVLNPSFSVLKVDPQNADKLYVGLRGTAPPPRTGAKGALYKSTDGGQTWSIDLLTNCHAQTIPNTTTDCEVTSLALDRTNPDILWVGQRGGDSPFEALMRSTDGGITWASRLTSPNNDTRLSISPLNPNMLWVLSFQGLDGQWVHSTTDSGATWRSASLDTTLNPPNRTILADPVDVNTAWASAGSEGLRRSTDGNQTWTMLAVSFHALDLVVPQALYGVSQVYDNFSSIQVSYDSGAHWFAVGEPGMVGMAEVGSVQAISVARY